MELNWSNVSNEELRAILASITTELTARDNAKAQRLRNAISKALDDLCNEYPNACWMVEFEDETDPEFRWQEIRPYVFSATTPGDPDSIWDATEAPDYCGWAPE